ncbi:MAG: hypothetical protein ACFCVE_10600 [Phycisphaerae bacterium]
MAQHNTPEAVGSYNAPARKSSSPVGWILGLLALAAIVLLLLWAFGAFSSDDNDNNLERNQAVESIENAPGFFITPGV